MSVCLKCLSAKKGQFHTAILVEVEVEVEVEVVVVVVVVEDLYMTFKTIL